jgi:hypothetical protein
MSNSIASTLESKEYKEAVQATTSPLLCSTPSLYLAFVPPELLPFAAVGVNQG